MSGELGALDAELFDTLPCGVVVTDEKGTILKVNKTFCTWVAMDPVELLGGRKLQELFTMGGRIFHQTHWAPALQMQGSLAEVKFDVRRKDGVVLPMMLNAVSKQQGEKTFHIVSLTVAEERNKYERELVAAKKRADDLVDKERASQAQLADRALFAEQMVGIVSHDLRNPLSAILIGASMLQRDVELTNERREKLTRTVLSSARTAQKLIEDLLDFTVARIGTGLAVHRQEGDFHELVSRIVDGLALAFPGRELRHVAVGQGPSLVDGNRVAQLLSNLVGNAMSYGDSMEPVTVTSEVGETVVRLSVHNAGPVIPDKTIATMFEPMVRGTQTDSAARSVGLGLFIVRAIATAHSGQVVVKSTAEGGTTFTFEFSPA